MKILKYELDMDTPIQAIDMPMHAELLSAQVQFDEHLVLWARAHPTNCTQTRWFYLLETGKEIPADRITNYISTVQFWNGDYVLHVCEGLKPHDR